MDTAELLSIVDTLAGTGEEGLAIETLITDTDAEKLAKYDPLGDMLAEKLTIGDVLEELELAITVGKGLLIESVPDEEIDPLGMIDPLGDG